MPLCAPKRELGNALPSISKADKGSALSRGRSLSLLNSLGNKLQFQLHSGSQPFQGAERGIPRAIFQSADIRLLDADDLGQLLCQITPFPSLNSAVQAPVPPIPPETLDLSAVHSMSPGNSCSSIKPPCSGSRCSNALRGQSRLA